MALPLWGELEKSTDDDQTIEEAIAEIVVAHNQNPDAHLGSNESLESHKQESVIDHPAGSVYPDKWSDREYRWQPAFEILDEYFTVGEVGIWNAGQVELYIEDGFAEDARLIGAPPAGLSDLDGTKRFLFEFTWRGDFSFFDVHGLVGLFGGNDFTADGIGFEYDEGSLYGLARSDTQTLRTSDFGIDISDTHFYRFRYDPTDEVVYFVVDGSVVGQLDLSSFDFDGGTDPYFYLENAGSDDGVFIFGSVRYNLEI